MNLFKKVTIGALSAAVIFALAACGGSFDKDAGYRDITSSLTLKKEYAGKNFIDNGIGLATIDHLTDGDTTTFILSSTSSSGKRTATVRYHGINTPESTGRVEKWGKSASKYTESRLSTAYEIVLEATSTPAAVDSNGTRYLGYVWYREDASDTFKNLNLELVENGYTKVSTVIEGYREVFAKAQSFAEEHAMHIWGNDTDPNFLDEAIKTSVQEISEDLKLDDPQLFSYDSEVGALVSFEGFIMSHEKSASQNYYVVGGIGTDGKLYTMNIYGAYDSYAVNSFLIVGSYYHFVGSIQLYNGKFQISGLNYVIGQTGDDYTHLIEDNYYTIFDSSNSRYKFSDEPNINSDLTITNAVVNGTVLTITGTALEYTGASQTTTYTLKANVEASYDVSNLVGKVIKINGINNEDGSIQIEASDIK